MLTRDQRILLNNVLDCLDRLFDRISTVSDVHALLVATAIALRACDLAEPFGEPVRRLVEIKRSKALPEQMRDLALVATDDLRGFVAQSLGSDAAENPKQRHVVVRSGARYVEPPNGR